MIVAFGQYSKLFKYLRNSKTYKAVIWLGAQSESFDTQKRVTSVNLIDKINIEDIKSKLNSLVGDIEYTPQNFLQKE